MFKRLVFIALGITIIAAKKSASLLSPNRRLSRKIPSAADAMPVGETMGETELEITASEKRPDSDNGSAPPFAQEEPVAAEGDDLTKINGIGPTYAARLQAAGITTFRDVARSTPEALREIAQVRGESADTASWIAQAEAELGRS